MRVKGMEQRALYALGPVSGRHFPTGTMEEVELQVFPDAGVGTDMLGAVGDGQVRASMSSSLWAGGGGPGLQAE